MSIGLTQSARDATGESAVETVEQLDGRLTVAIVVPCFNEREALPQLFERLEHVEAALADRADLHWCFVDDGSTDGTWAALRDYAEGTPGRSVIRHEVNRGVSAAIMTGVANTDAPIVCSIDADCTYDPSELSAMLEKLEGDVAVVTASPYHPDGGVSGVAAWRLWLSKLASTGYRGLARNKLHTYTSCFRAYRREAIADFELRRQRFAGVAEILWHVDRRGGRIVEHPTVLSCRKVGRSKLRVLPVMFEHMQLMGRCAMERIVGSRRRLPSSSPKHGVSAQYTSGGAGRRTHTPPVKTTDLYVGAKQLHDLQHQESTPGRDSL